MAASFVAMDRTKSLSAQVLNLLDRLSSDFAALQVQHDAMLQKLDGDGSDATHFALFVSTYGYPDNATSKRSFDEISSFIATAGPSLEQCCAIHRQ